MMTAAACSRGFLLGRVNHEETGAVVGGNEGGDGVDKPELFPQPLKSLLDIPSPRMLFKTSSARFGHPPCRMPGMQSICDFAQCPFL